MSPAKALYLARATMECGEPSGFLHRDCLFIAVAGGDCLEAAWIQAIGFGSPNEQRVPFHDAAASALLDGFGLDEVTAAEVALGERER